MEIDNGSGSSVYVEKDRWDVERRLEVRCRTRHLTHTEFPLSLESRVIFKIYVYLYKIYVYKMYVYFPSKIGKWTRERYTGWSLLQ